MRIEHDKERESDRLLYHRERERERESYLKDKREVGANIFFYSTV